MPFAAVCTPLAGDDPAAAPAAGVPAGEEAGDAGGWACGPTLTT